MQRAASTQTEGPEVSVSLVVSMGIKVMEANDTAEEDVTSEMGKGDRQTQVCNVTQGRDLKFKSLEGFEQRNGKV